jgi:hypothetical protein
MRKSTGVVPLVAVVGLMLLVGCGATPKNVPHSTTKGLQHNHMVECVQKSTTIAIDPAVVRPLVPPSFELYTQPDGQANIAFLFKKCSKLVVDDQNIGSGAYVSHGVRITGPHEVIPVPGTAVTQPTFYFYDLEDQSDNTRFAEAGKESGFPFSFIKSADWVSTGKERSGTVVEKDGVRYAWKEVQNIYAGPVPIGVNLKVYHKGSTSRVQCTLRPTGRNSLTTIEAGPGSAFARFYAVRTLQGLSIDSDTVCNAIWKPAGD